MSLKKTLVLLCGLLFLAPGAWAQSSSISGVTDSISSMTDKIAPVLPAAAGIGLDWSDAWIGYLAGVPPHFGLGLTVGAVFIPADGFKPLFDAFGASLPSSLATLGLPVPVYNLNARLGGFFLPFDIGFKLGVIPQSALKISDVSLDYLLVGGDFRYALLQDGITPGISVGLGVNYMTTTVKTPISGISSQSFNAAGIGVVTMSQPTATLAMDNLSLDIKAQISKSLLLITPYAGGVLTISGTTIKGSVDSTVTVGGVAVTQAQINQLNSLTGANFTATGFSKTVSKSGVIGFKIYGGASLNLAVIKIDLQALYNLPSGNLGMSLGTRLQI